MSLGNALNGLQKLNAYGVGGGRFSPATTVNRKVWLKNGTGLYQNTAGTTPVTANGQSVLRWNDSSGNGNDFTRVVFGGADSTWQANGVTTGVGAVRIQSDPLVSGNIGPLDRRQASIFMVVNQRSITEFPVVGYCTTASTLPDGIALNANAYGRPGYESQGSQTQSDVANPYLRPVLISAVFTPTTVNYSVNDRLSTTVSTTITQTTFQALGVGPKSGLFSNFELAELLYIDRSIGASERLGLINYYLTTFPTIRSTARTKNFVIYGNSIGQGALSSIRPFYHLSLSNAGYQVENSYNQSTSGFTTANLISTYSARIPPLYKSGLGAGNNVALVWETTNTLAANGSTATAQSDLQTLCNLFKADGWKVIVGTCMDRTSLFTGGQNTAGFQAAAATVNTWIRANYTNFADAIWDVAADPLLGAVNASTNATYFTDGTHPNQTGHDQAAATSIAW